jgi:hypothetical protein
LANNNRGVKQTTGIRNYDASITVLHFFLPLTTQIIILNIFLPLVAPLDSAAKKQLLLGRKNIGGAFATPLHPPSYAYVQ